MVYTIFLPKYDSLFLLSELYSWEHWITTELQTDFAQWLRLNDASWYHEGSQKSIRTSSCQSSCIGLGKICLNLAGGREDWKSILELQMFGFLRYVALFLLWLPRMSCPRSSYMEPACLINKTNAKSPFPGNLGVFPLWTECLSCLPCAADERGQDGFIVAHSGAGCHQCEAGAVLPPSPSSWWCHLALPSETPSSHTCHGNLITAFPKPVFTFFVPLVPSLWFFS